MKLDVPLLRQGKGTNDCGILCAAMILKYYKVHKDVDELNNEIRKIDPKVRLKKSDYTYMPQVALWLKRNGFETEIITHNPFLFMNKDKGRGSKTILPRLRVLEKLWRKQQKAWRYIAARYFIDYINDGGRFLVEIPTPEVLRSEIRNKRPVSVIMTSNFLYRAAKKPVFNFHSVVVTGIDKKYVYVNDPLHDSRGGRHKYPIDEFMYGINASAYGAPDNASILRVTKGKLPK